MNDEVINIINEMIRDYREYNKLQCVCTTNEEKYIALAKICVLEELRKKINGQTKTDTERLDKLQKLTVGYGNGWVCRKSKSGRGIRLHETSDIYSFKNIRDAIDDFI